MSGPLTSALKSGSKDLIKELNRRLAPAVGKYSVRTLLVDFASQSAALPLAKPHLRLWHHRTLLLNALKAPMFGQPTDRNTWTWPVVCHA